VTKLAQRTYPVAATPAVSASAAKTIAAPPSSADTDTRLSAAAGYTERKDYSAAEDIYKQVLKKEPNNIEALKGLASVLYREDKIDESTAVLDRIPAK
jgi:thioredoxin-like negative regulator of GroEL